MRNMTAPYIWATNCVVSIILTWLIPARSYNITLAIFTPLNCSSEFDSYKDTVDLAFQSGSKMLQGTTWEMFDSCDDSKTLDNIIDVLRDSTFDGLIGPGCFSLCSLTGKLGSFTNKPVVSWSCPDSEMASERVYRTFARSLPSNDQTAGAMSRTLKFFRWHYVSIVFTDHVPFESIANQAYVSLSRSGFDITHYVALHYNNTQSQTFQALQEIGQETKVIILSVATADLVAVLKAAHTAGFTDGKHAIFLLSTHQSVKLDTNGHISLETIFGSTLNNESSFWWVEALDSVMLVEAHPHSIRESAKNLTQYSPIVENLYNAIQLMKYASYSTLSITNHLDGTVFAQEARNITFPGLHGNISTTQDGDALSFFSVWDFRVSTMSYEMVLELPYSEETVIQVSAINWPGSHQPGPDTCKFELCTYGLQVAYIAVIVIMSLAVVVGAIGVAFVIRRRMIVKEMEKGPNKILLFADDLVFVSPNNFTKSTKSFNRSSFFDKPDLLRASEPSSASSLKECPDYTNTARYQGDLVYVKHLLFRSFEMKGSVRSFLKQLRDLRHENINSFVGLFADVRKPSIVWEFCSRRSLEDVIHNEDISLDWDFKLSLLTDLVRGLKYIHGSPIKQHGLLKSGNCVIDSRWVLKITDYGVTGLYEKYQTRLKHQAKELLWTSPELLRDEQLLHRGTQKGDVFSLAIIMQEVILRGQPYCMLQLDPEEIVRKVRKPPPLIRPSVSKQAAPPQYIQLMKQCWAEMPDMRPDCDEIHQQFKDFNKGKRMNIVDTMFKMLEKYSSQLEEIVRERTTQLEEEKKKTENLLSQMLPPSVAHSLLVGKPVEAETFEEVTIYFSDIVGFTTISAISTPMQVVSLLNDLYTMFDATIDDFDVYKVETIGDAYMVVSGLPVRNGIRHAGEISTMALDLLSQCGQFKIRHMPDIPLRLRIGLHTGPCVTGVVGLRMPRYCLFGDTVNTASRMESTGSAFRIHLSGTTKEKLDIIGGYQLEYRGEVELKGKGVAKTYWLTGKGDFTKPLPEPPAMTGSDNHGLESYLAKHMSEEKPVVEAKDIRLVTENHVPNDSEQASEKILSRNLPGSINQEETTETQDTVNSIKQCTSTDTTMSEA